MTQVTIVTGSAGAGKTARLLDDYRVALQRARTERTLGVTLWITPTQRIQRAVSQKLMAQDGAACFLPNVLTFDRFAERILQSSPQLASLISPVMKRLLIRRITSQLLEQGELRHFQPIAATTGFLDVISSFISELKREEIWPDTFVAACQKRKSAFARRDLELGMIYEQYQKHLTDQNWYDNEGRFWLARKFIADGQRHPFQDVRTLVIDGFADFTQTQYEILGSLAGWIENITISLPVEDPMKRIGLFSKSQAAIDRIRENLPKTASRHFQLMRASLPTDPSCDVPLGRNDWSNSIRVIADNLFSNPRDHQRSTDASGLEVIAATGQAGEWEAVACRIKQLLAGNPGDDIQNRSNNQSKIVRPQDIVIGLRSIEDDGPRLRDYLASAGLPVWCEAELPLTRNSIVKMVSSLLQFELEDWPFERLMHLLDSTSFQPEWPELSRGRAARAVAASLRKLRIHTGRELMLKVLGRYASDSGPSSSSRSDSLSSLARRAIPLLTRLSRFLDRLRQSHTLADWADVLATITEEFGWSKLPALPTDELAANRPRDLELLQGILRTAAEADQKLAGNAPPKSLALAEFVSEFRDLLNHETIRPIPEPGGCILILSVEQIRNLDIPHLFLMGMIESSFPRNRTDDCLFSEFERQDFAKHGVALRHRSSQHADEMSLFYSVVTRARRCLTISYSAVNAKGQEVFPSPYVNALKSLFAKKVVSKSGQLNPVPKGEHVLTMTDLRLAAMSAARNDRPELFRAVMEVRPLQRAMWNTLAACEVADQRFHQRGFTTYEGRLELARNQSLLQQRFGSQHQFSATELELYSRCPFRFWLEKVLNVAVLDSPEESTDAIGRGMLLHEVLARLLTEGHLTDQANLSVQFSRFVDELLDREIPETSLQKALIKAERSILLHWADAIARQHSAYNENFRELLDANTPYAAEISFGNLPDASEADKNSRAPIEFGMGERTVKLRGRIDRIDIGSFEGHPAYVVIDYKTGRPPSSADAEISSGRSIQLALYLIAIKRLGLVDQAAIPFQMGYWALKENGFKPGIGRAKVERIPLEKVDWLALVLDTILPQFADEIRSGRFVVENEDLDCTGHCPYRTACRVNQLRPLATSLGKQSAPRVIDELQE